MGMENKSNNTMENTYTMAANENETLANITISCSVETFNVFKPYTFYSMRVLFFTRIPRIDYNQCIDSTLKKQVLCAVFGILLW